MKLIYYCWEPDIDGSWPQISDRKPEDIEIDESRMTWKFFVDGPRDPRYGKEYQIGGTEYAKTAFPFARFTKDCIAVFNAEDLDHIRNLESLAFHLGTTLRKPA